MTPDERMARAEALARIHELAAPGNNMSAVLRGLVADLRAARDASERDRKMRSNACAAVVLAQEWIAERDSTIEKLRRELADLRAQVVSALSAAGPSEDERTA